MEREQLKNLLSEEYIDNSAQSLEEAKNCERNESLFGLTQGKICENCNFIETSIQPGPSIRRCQACARKNSFEKKNCHEENRKEEKLEIDYDLKDDSIAIPTCKLVMEVNTKLEENSKDYMIDSHSENFVVEHEHDALQNAIATKVHNFTYNEDGKVVSRRKDIALLNRKEYKSLNSIDSTSRKEKTFPKGSHHLDKDNTMANEKEEEVIETLNAQKIKEEIELEKRERGWNVNGSIACKNGYASRKEQRDRINKLKSLKEKPDTQRIFGLVAKRTESRLNSPTHRLPNPNYKNNEEVPLITQFEIYPYSLKLQETNHETTKSSEVGSNLDEFDKSSFYTNMQEVSKSKFDKSPKDSKSKCSSPSNLDCHPNKSLLFGTQRILEILAKRSGNRVTSPSPNIEVNTSKSESNNIAYNELGEQSKPNKSQNDQQQENVIGLPKTTTNAYNEHDLMYKIKNGKKLDSNYKTSSNAHIYKIQRDLEHNNISLTNSNFYFNDSQIYNTHLGLGLDSQRSEKSTLSPKNFTYYNSRDKSLLHLHGNQPNIVEGQNEIVMSCSVENQDNPPSKVIHSTSTLHNQNIIYKKNEDLVSLKRKIEEGLSMPNSPRLKFSTPFSTICHVNDNPIYGTKFESEPTSCTTNNSNENCLHTSNPSSNLISKFSPIAHNSFDKPLKYTTNEALDTEPSKICSTLFLRSSPIYNSKDMTPLYKSAMTTPMSKSPQLEKEESTPSIIQKESGCHLKEVEIVEEKKLISKNRRFEELCPENFEKNNNRFENENDRTLEVIQSMDLNKRYCKEKIMFNHNPKSYSCKNIFKYQIVLWPIQIIFRIFIYPFKLVLKLILFFSYLFKVFWRGIFKGLKKFKYLTMTSVGNIRSKILENFQNRCNKAKGYFGCGCASKIYILVVFSSLLLPNLFDLDFYFINRFIQGQVVIREVLNFDYTKDHPSATVNLLPQEIMGKAKGYFPDKEVMSAHAFPPSYVFNMIVHLTLPESKYNQEIGMFQISIETFSARGHSLNKASRASMLRYHSPPIKYMRSAIIGIPIILGLCQESQTLSIQMIKSQEENEHSPTATVNVEIEPKVGHSTSYGVPEIYHAELQVIAHNPYLREVARSWVWNLYVYSGLVLFIFEILLVLCCCQKIFPQKVFSKRKNEDILSKNKKMIFEQGHKYAQAPKRLHRGNIYYSKDLPLALPNI